MLEIRLPMYSHEWRAIAPNNRTLALYEDARLRAIEVNTGADFSEIRTDLQEIAAGNADRVLAERLSNFIEEGLKSIGENMAFRAFMAGDMNRALQFHGLAIEYFCGPDFLEA